MYASGYVRFLDNTRIVSGRLCFHWLGRPCRREFSKRSNSMKSARSCQHRLVCGALIMGILVWLASPASADQCSGEEHYARQLVRYLASYAAARAAGSADEAQAAWKGATKDITAIAWSSDPSLSNGNCGFASHAVVHYASGWYAVVALGNGTYERSRFRIELVKTELGMARSDAACANLSFSKPTLDELESKLRHQSALAGYDYASIDGYPDNGQCVPY